LACLDSLTCLTKKLVLSLILQVGKKRSVERSYLALLWLLGELVQKRLKTNTPTFSRIRQHVKDVYRLNHLPKYPLIQVISERAWHGSVL